MTRRLPAVLLAAALTATLPALPVAAQPPSTTPSEGEPTGTGRAVVADGHVDLGPRFLDGTWRLQIRDDTTQPVVWRNLPDIVLHAVDTAAETVPQDPAFAFLGPPGTKVWVLPQTQQAGILWPGWNTQDPTVVRKINREATWRLLAVDGPGRFALFLNTSFGAPQILFDSGKPYPQETGIEAGSHVHGNWAFGAPGTYLLDVEMSATTTDGAAVSDRQRLRIFVGPGDPNSAFDAGPGTTAQPTSTPQPPSSSSPVTSSPSPGTPEPRAAETAPESGVAPWILIAAGVLVLLLVGGGGLLWSRRRRSRKGEAS